MGEPIKYSNGIRVQRSAQDRAKRQSDIESAFKERDERLAEIDDEIKEKEREYEEIYDLNDTHPHHYPNYLVTQAERELEDLEQEKKDLQNNITTRTRPDRVRPMGRMRGANAPRNARRR